MIGLSGLAVAAFLAFMASGSGRAAEPSSGTKAEAKADAKPEVKADAKPEAKAAVTKPAVPSPAKDGASTNKEPPTRSAGQTETAGKIEKTDKDAKGAKDVKGADGEAKDAQKAASPTGATAQHRTKTKRKRDGSPGNDEPEPPPGQGPPPPSPLTVNDLRQETNRERGPGGDFNAPPRMKLEQLLSEVNKARQSLHDDTLKLEALAGNEPGHAAESAAADPAVPAAPGAPGQPPQKNPLDVLAKALRGIKPEQAGPIVARLDKGLAATVLLKMPPVDAGKIMGALKPEVAADLATQIAMRAPTPQLGGKR